MPRYATITCHPCTHTAPLHLFPRGHNGRDRIRRCPNCNCIVQINGILVNDAIPGYQRFTFPKPSKLSAAPPLDIQETIPIIGYIDATTPNIIVHIQDATLEKQLKAPLEVLFNKITKAEETA